MTRLGLVSSLVGGFLVATRLPGIIWPEKFREHALKFPRSMLWGRILMGIAAAIAWAVMYNAASDEWAWARPLILIGVPIAYWLVIQYGTHFLAMRAVAALTLLIARQMVDAADASDLPFRLFVTILAYIWVVAAIWVTIAPHHFRDLLSYFMANDKRCRAACSFGAGLGVLLVALGVFVY
jgi:uncharacterized membrane protein (DUF485 family)